MRTSRLNSDKYLKNVNAKKIVPVASNLAGNSKTKELHKNTKTIPRKSPNTIYKNLDLKMFANENIENVSVRSNSNINMEESVNATGKNGNVSNSNEKCNNAYSTECPYMNNIKNSLSFNASVLAINEKDISITFTKEDYSKNYKTYGFLNHVFTTQTLHEINSHAQITTETIKPMKSD